MSDEKDNFETVLAEWQLKHGIQDDDVVLHLLDLLKIFFKNVKVEIPPDTNSTKLATVRTSVNELTQLTTDFSKEARELKREIRSLPKLIKPLYAGRAVAFVLVAVASLAAGILIGIHLHWN